MILISMACFAATATGQYTGASARLEKDTILIGDQNTLELTVTVPRNSVVHWPSFADYIAENIEVLRKSGLDTLSSDTDLYTLRQTLLVTVFDSGSHIIPPIIFKYTVKGDTMAFFTESMPVILEVGAPVINPEEDIKPIKPPLRAPVTFREMLPWIGLALVLMLAAFLAYYFFFRRKKSPLPVTTRLKPSIPPHEAALEAFETLRRKKLWQAGRVKDYYSEMTEIVREYIELRFPVRAMEMTTGEIEAALRQTGVNPEDLDRLSQTLQLADLVKFAKAQPLPLENDTSLNSCVGFVRATRPGRDEAPAAEATGEPKDHQKES